MKFTTLLVLVLLVFSAFAFSGQAEDGNDQMKSSSIVAVDSTDSGMSTSRKGNVLFFVAGLALLAGITVIGAAIFRQTGSFELNPEKLLQREKYLRQYQVQNWLKLHKTQKELLELCLNHFYADQPKLLGWGLDIVDGDPKGLVIARIIRESSKNVAQAEVIYDQLQRTVDQARAMIDEVSRNSGMLTADSRKLDPSIARAGVVALGYSPYASADVVIVNRPVSITACAILLFMSAALTLLFIVGDFPGADKIKDMVGKPGLYLSIVFTAVCAYGYWTMKRWAVLLYAIEPILRFWAGVPQGLIALPLMIVAFGVLNFKDMTWK